MISILLPYWDRQAVADKSLKQLDEIYKGLDLEIIVVDDGNRVPFKAPYISLPVRVLTLPVKDEPKSPVTCWNEAAKVAKGDILVISCIEVLHPKNVLSGLVEELERLGQKGYALAAAWCPEANDWHCHSTCIVPDFIPGVGLGFCGVMFKSLYESVGGFTDAYREGAGYEDRDFIQKLLKAGAKFKIRDDLVVTHPKSGATIQWGAEKFARNRDLYYSTWGYPKPINIVCVEWGNYQGRGKQYVNTLYDMVLRALPPSIPFRFQCFTDDETGLDDGIEARTLPGDLIGWDNKIYLFKPGLFDDGEQVIFFDLDTVITGRIDSLISYRGDFATLRDFWRPNGLGPAVMSWKAGINAIWDEFVKAGKPRLRRGDQEWLERYFTTRPDILQDLFPGEFVSYKTHCLPFPPKDAKVVCFHGEPRPHNCIQKWVQDVWQVGGSNSLDLNIVPNTGSDVVLSNARENEHAAPWLRKSDAHGEIAFLCGSGPSLMDCLPFIKAHASKGKVFALNNAGKILKENGVEADYQVLLDPRPENVEFIREQYVKAYLVASQVHPDIFKTLQGRVVAQWHPAIEGIADLFPSRDMTLIGGGITVGLCAMTLAYAMGFRQLMLFGYDSSYRGDKGHAAPQRRTPVENWTFDVTVFDKTFKSNAAMTKQAEQFPHLAKALAEECGCEIHVFGDGLLPYIAQKISTT